MKVGDYVRTNDGIGKMTKYIYEPEYENCHVIWFDNNNYGIRYIDNEIKSSPNLIDLIEVGDYVNGYLVKGKTNDEVIVDYYCYSKELCDGHYLHWHKDYIEAIVTKEAFSSVEYRVENN